MKWTLIAKEIPHPIRHKTIFEKFDEMAVGDVIELKTDHEPVPLFVQFQNLKNQCFTWDSHADNQNWMTLITKIKSDDGPKKKEGCCGCC